jgi:hypothetical protein
MIEVVVLIPVADNHGKRFTRREWQAFEDRLFTFGGLTREGDVAGTWRSGTSVYRDVSRRYVVALESWWQLPAWLEVVDWARVWFRQEALYVRVAGVPEVRRG